MKINCAYTLCKSHLNKKNQARKKYIGYRNMNSHETLWRNYVTSSHKSIILKANRGEKNRLPHWNDRLRAHLSAAAAEVRRQSSNISKRLVTNNCLQSYRQPEHHGAFGCSQTHKGYEIYLPTHSELLQGGRTSRKMNTAQYRNKSYTLIKCQPFTV